MISFIYVAFLLVALFAASVSSQESTVEQQHPLTNMPPSHEKIQAQHLYPDNKEDILAGYEGDTKINW